MAPAELEKFPGFWRDAEKSRAEAKKLLAEAGYPNGLKVTLKNRNVKLPYQDFAVYVIQEWRKIGIEAEHRPLETATWYADGRDQGNFELMVYPVRRLGRRPRPAATAPYPGSPQNWGRASNPAIEDLYSRQTRTLDPAERRRLVIEFQKIVLENVYILPGPLVVAQRRPLGQGEELRGAPQPLRQPEAPGRLARRGLSRSRDATPGRARRRPRDRRAVRPAGRRGTHRRRGGGDPAPRRRAAGGHRRRRAEPRSAPGGRRSPRCRWSRRSTARSCSSTRYSYPKIIGDLAAGLEDRARRADVHVQDPSGRQVPRRLAADLGRRQGHLRQDRVPARGRAQQPEERLQRHRARRGAGPAHRRVQAQVPVGLPARGTWPRRGT